MPVTDGLVFENQAILPGRPPHSIANLEDESRGLSLHELRARLLQMGQQGSLYVIRLTDVDPFARIRDSINSRRNRRIDLDSHGNERSRNELVKGHSTYLMDLVGERRRGQLAAYASLNCASCYQRLLRRWPPPPPLRSV